MQGGTQTTGRLCRALLAAGALACVVPCAHAAIGTAQVGATIVAPVRIESQAVNPAMSRAADDLSKLVVAVSTEVAASDLPRITYAFN